LPFYHVTEYGKSAIANGPQSPYDPDGYLNRLKATIPNLDPVILTYLNESLHTFRIGCLLSSSVTLGCASEKAMLLLIDAYASALPSGATKDRFIKATEGKMIKTQYDEFLKMLDGHLRAKLPGFSRCFENCETRPGIQRAWRLDVRLPTRVSWCFRPCCAGSTKSSTGCRPPHSDRVSRLHCRCRPHPGRR